MKGFNLYFIMVVATSFAAESVKKKIDMRAAFYMAANYRQTHAMALEFYKKILVKNKIDNCLACHIQLHLEFRKFEEKKHRSRQSSQYKIFHKLRDQVRFPKSFGKN